jgi:hypothetical protein
MLVRVGCVLRRLSGGRFLATDRFRDLRGPFVAHRIWVADPAGVTSGYIRGAGGVAIGSRRVAGIVVGLSVAIMVLLVVMLTVSAIDEQSRNSRLRSLGVPVDVTVTRCVGRASGTGITTVGYTCRGEFTLAGEQHEAVIGGASVSRVPGERVRAVVDPRDPSVLVTARSVAPSASSWTAFIAPASLFVALLGVVAVARWRLRLTAAVAVLTRRKPRMRPRETPRP